MPAGMTRTLSAQRTHFYCVFGIPTPAHHDSQQRLTNAPGTAQGLKFPLFRHPDASHSFQAHFSPDANPLCLCHAGGLTDDH
ncbi:hypothetical protein DFP72DRAFT_1081904 [Ephemerocybe angulata]|uniref:Uncharacterized protein n=1 Tax=Ephemerocybe angulata TaxID=980116 RepID=A0A8H6H8Q6_9AGAR|nr:hypothetical protein DFP72DRAFT_1081904 [Tulosesus angulatus]